VTGGRPSSHMRVPMPAVVTTQATAVIQKAERASGAGRASQEKSPRKKASAYRTELA